MMVMSLPPHPANPVFSYIEILDEAGKRERENVLLSFMVGGILARKRSVHQCCMGRGLSRTSMLWFGPGASRHWAITGVLWLHQGAPGCQERLHPPWAVDPSAWTHELPYCPGSHMQHISCVGFLCCWLGLLCQGLNGSECFTLALHPSEWMRKLQGDTWDKLRGNWDRVKDTWPKAKHITHHRLGLNMENV